MKSIDRRHSILLILTGGTICSFADENGERDSNALRAQTLIVNNFMASDSVYASEDAVSFDIKMPLDILSENMTTTHWNTLIGCMREYDYSRYDGVIMLHGTDTLAYTASLLSILMAGTKIPVILVSSQLPAYEPEANGNANFRAAVELIINGIKPNVYAVYRNAGFRKDIDESRMFLHYGSHLLQCTNRSENFYSLDMIAIDTDCARYEGHSSGEREMPLMTCAPLFPCVLRIAPYVGINYDWYSLDGVKAVLHGTHHSSTMAVDPYKEDDEGTNHAVVSLKMRCDRCTPPVPLYLEPCSEEAYNYATTGKILRFGAKCLWRTTPEMSYIKLLLGCSMGLEGDALDEYLNTEINGEFIYTE